MGYAFPRALTGHSGAVKVSEIAAVPLEIGSALRHRRVFHPRGVLADGYIERIAGEGEGLPLNTGRVVGRVSKAAGTPGGWPDIAGLAWRSWPQPDTPWDLLLASTGRGRVGRVLLRPVQSWRQTTFSTLMPFWYDDRLWWIRATSATPIDGGLSLDTVREHVAGGGVQFAIDQASGTGAFTPLARLTFDALHAGEDVSFDPTRHTAPGVALLPGWVTEFRSAAYRRSREGRHAGNA
jgi:hypothetical protein